MTKDLFAIEAELRATGGLAEDEVVVGGLPSGSAVAVERMSDSARRYIAVPLGLEADVSAALDPSLRMPRRRA